MRVIRGKGGEQQCVLLLILSQARRVGGDGVQVHAVSCEVVAGGETGFSGESENGVDKRTQVPVLDKGMKIESCSC